VIIQILLNFTNNQRQLIKTKYQDRYKQVNDMKLNRREFIYYRIWPMETLPFRVFRKFLDIFQILA